MNKRTILVIIGTRPEAIKMWPVINWLKESSEIDLKVCLTAQHRDLLDQLITELEIPVDVDLNLMMHDQSLSEFGARLFTTIDKTYNNLEPDMILVQGDTSSAVLAALAAFYRRIFVGHVEAGLRTGVRLRPFPEEMNRRLLADLADLHFAPTERARKNLLAEGVKESSIFVTGNTVIDTVQAFSVRGVVTKRPAILLTVHRRESFGAPLREIFGAVATLAECHPELQIICPIHPNPEVQGPAREILGGIANIRIVNPMGYREFISMMQSVWFMLSDSGGVQEEATALGCPVLLLRKETERPEGIAVGNVLSVGASRQTILETAESLIGDEEQRNRMSKVSQVFGAGYAGKHIARICVDFLSEVNR
jgi:UDP-N-acetylglucosamine 2-epimerase (non-hydrolysing)